MPSVFTMNCSFKRFLSSSALVLAVSYLTSSGFAEEKPGTIILEPNYRHLGDDIVDLFKEVPSKPEGTRLDLKFDAKKNPKDYTVTMTVWDVNYAVAVEVNGKKVDEIAPTQARKEVYVNIPAGSLANGKNTLSIIPNPTDNTFYGKIVLHEKSFREMKKLQTLTLNVVDEKTGKSIPARVTITDSKGARKEIFFPAPKSRTAVRSGLIYIAGETKVELVEGDYVVYATRGMEWSLDKKTVSLNRAAKVNLSLRREVDTKGFIASDSHIHTVTFSGHGDARVEERMITLAGEGVELAISTDHNHHTDYKPFQTELGLNKYFTPAIGNEVTTKVGHINAFPFKSSASVPDWKDTNWVVLAKGIREQGAKVVVLNHPRWSRLDALGHQGFNPVTGERGSGVPVPFDGMELINSGAALTDKMQLVNDWFALLNYGEPIKAIGASDSHAVGAIVGQGRTYIPSSTDDPAKIDVDKACESILKGKISASLGIFADVTVNGSSRMGDTLSVKGGELEVALRVASASWITPEQVLIYLNGTVVADAKLPSKSGKAFDETLRFRIPSPKFDSHLVCVVFGPGVKGPYWETERDYTMAATNPVYVDADGDGKYTFPRQIAQKLIATTPAGVERRWQAASALDDGIAIQFLDLAWKAANAADRAELEKRLKQSDRKKFQEFAKTLRVPEKTASVK